MGKLLTAFNEGLIAHNMYGIICANELVRRI